ncbi:MAG TPA: arylsulfatase, partial [Pseudomonas sp.]|nr:arylsulfatase [Pseudomonas sp.]
KRMETIDDEFLNASLNFMDKAVKADKPFFVWFNSTRMHYYTHLRKESEGLSGQGFYNDGMVEHDNQVGTLLKKLDDLGVAKNTIVIYTTDNGVHFNQWPDAGITPFRGEKNTNWEGGFRVPAMIRWPEQIKPNKISNEIVSAQDWVPTLLAAAGVPDVKEKLLAGYKAGDKQFKVHLDGYNLLPYLEGKEEKSPRTDFYYFSDDGKLLAVRDGDWKVVFAEQRARRFDVWRDPFVDLRAPKIFNLRRDPYERADTDSNSYNLWWDKKVFVVGFPAMHRVQNFLMTFQDYPPRQRPASFTVDQMTEKLLDLKSR